MKVIVNDGYWKVKELVGVKSVKFTRPMPVLVVYKCRGEWYRRIVVFDDVRGVAEVYDNAGEFLENYGGSLLYVVGPVSGEHSASEIADWLRHGSSDIDMLEKETLVSEDDAVALGWCQ